ncbi:MAG: hypothetical protein IKG17_08445 [Mogibacterium sp.]|nr:hypothetical protein [Mogibacterium sp.]
MCGADSGTLASLGSAIASSLTPRHGTFAELASLRHPHNVIRAAFVQSVQLARFSRHARLLLSAPRNTQYKNG